MLPPRHRLAAPVLRQVVASEAAWRAAGAEGGMLSCEPRPPVAGCSLGLVLLKGLPAGIELFSCVRLQPPGQQELEG